MRAAGTVWLQSCPDVLHMGSAWWWWTRLTCWQIINITILCFGRGQWSVPFMSQMRALAHPQATKYTKVLVTCHLEIPVFQHDYFPAQCAQLLCCGQLHFCTTQQYLHWRLSPLFSCRSTSNQHLLCSWMLVTKDDILPSLITLTVLHYSWTYNFARYLHIFCWGINNRWQNFLIIAPVRWHKAVSLTLLWPSSKPVWVGSGLSLPQNIWLVFKDVQTGRLFLKKFCFGLQSDAGLVRTEGQSGENLSFEIESA